jgi:hypothetical protein
MYPLNLFRAADVGYAVANNEAEHKALSDAGYMPAFVASDVASDVLPDPVARKPGRPKKVVTDAGN